MKKKGKLSEKIERIKKNPSRIKVVRELCEEIFDAFEMPGDDEGSRPSVLINKLASWHDIVPDTIANERFEDLYRAINGLCHRLYDGSTPPTCPEIDTRPILDFLREKKLSLHASREEGSLDSPFTDGGPKERMRQLVN